MVLIGTFLYGMVIGTFQYDMAIGTFQYDMVIGTFLYAEFEIKVLFHAPLGCIHIETVRLVFFLCTPLICYNDN